VEALSNGKTDHPREWTIRPRWRGSPEPCQYKRELENKMSQVWRPAPAEGQYRLFQYLTLGFQPEILFCLFNPRLHLGLEYASLSGCAFNLSGFPKPGAFFLYTLF
jgi:hypothetical protein